jgi:hypothetical protein
VEIFSTLPFSLAVDFAVRLIWRISAGASAFHWRYQIAELGRTHRVFALDLIGFGFTDKPNITYTNKYWGQQVDILGNCIVNSIIAKPAIKVTFQYRLVNIMMVRVGLISM